MAGGLERLTRKIGSIIVSQNRRIELLNLNNRVTEDRDEAPDDLELREAIDRITPSKFPSYKRKRLEESLTTLVSQYGTQILLELNSGDLNSKGEISQPTLRDLKRRK